MAGSFQVTLVAEGLSRNYKIRAAIPPSTAKGIGNFLSTLFLISIINTIVVDNLNYIAFHP